MVHFPEKNSCDNYKIALPRLFSMSKIKMEAVPGQGKVDKAAQANVFKHAYGKVCDQKRSLEGRVKKG